MGTLLLASGAFALLVVCPWMAGMADLIAETIQANPVQIAIIGPTLSLTLIIAMVLVEG